MSTTNYHFTYAGRIFLASNNIYIFLAWKCCKVPIICFVLPQKRHYHKKTLLTPRETASCFPVFFTRRRSAGGRLASHLHKKRSNDVTDQRRKSKHALLPQSSPGARGLPLQPLLAPGVRSQNSFPCGWCSLGLMPCTIARDE